MSIIIKHDQIFDLFQDHSENNSVFWVQDRASCSIDMAELSRCYLLHNGSSPHGKSCPGILQCSYRCHLLWE